MSKDKPTKAERVHHNVITSVRTKKYTYNVSVNKTQIRVTEIHGSGKNKKKVTWTKTWDDFDEMYDTHYKIERKKKE